MAGAFDPGCLFCKIIAGDSPSETVYQDDLVVAFRDRYPKTPTHILIVCREHIPTLDYIGEEHSGLMARIVMVASRLARQEGIATNGYRLGVNVGRWGGQAIYHVHFHLMGGMPLRGEG